MHRHQDNGRHCHIDPFNAFEAADDPHNARRPEKEVNLSNIVQEVMDSVYAGFHFDCTSRATTANGMTNSTTAVATNKSGVNVVLDIADRAEGWEFFVHAGIIRRICLNLAVNAVKYTTAGWVLVSLEAKELPPRDRDGVAPGTRKALVTLTIADTGCGIGKEFLKTSLFTPFSQEDPLQAGTGLGMSFVRQLCQSLAGRIDVRSQVGKGTEVTVSLALLQRDRRLDQPQPPGLPPAPPADGPTQEMVALREALVGRSICFGGFDDDNGNDGDDTSPGTGPGPAGVKARGLSLLKTALSRYAMHWLGMRVTAPHQPWQLLRSAEDADFVVVHDGPQLQRYLLTAHSVGPGHSGGPALVTICASMTCINVYRASPYRPLEGAASFIANPVGPLKLARVLGYCLGWPPEKGNGERAGIEGVEEDGMEKAKGEDDSEREKGGDENRVDSEGGENESGRAKQGERESDMDRAYEGREEEEEEHHPQLPRPAGPAASIKTNSNASEVIVFPNDGGTVTSATTLVTASTTTFASPPSSACGTNIEVTTIVRSVPTSSPSSSPSSFPANTNHITTTITSPATAVTTARRFSNAAEISLPYTSEKLAPPLPLPQLARPPTRPRRDSHQSPLSASPSYSHSYLHSRSQSISLPTTSHPMSLSQSAPQQRRGRNRDREEKKEGKGKGKGKGGERLNILVVEDNSVNAMLLVTFAKKCDCNYEVAVDGLEALRAVQRAEVGFWDIILMGMPFLSLNFYLLLSPPPSPPRALSSADAVAQTCRCPS